MSLFAPGLGVMLLSLSAQAETPRNVVPPTTEVLGKSFIEYTVLWWQWANRVPDGVKPYQDPTGSQCQLNQTGEVWFLADTDGTDVINRHCTVPTGMYIFIPIISMLSHSVPGKPLTCDQAKANAAANNNHLAQAEVEIDGQQVPDIASYRIRSIHCFDAYPAAPYITKKESYYPAATDGYWLMLKPLSLGQHKISVKARYDNAGNAMGDMEQIFEYQLNVEDKKDEEPVKPKVAFRDVIV